MAKGPSAGTLPAHGARTLPSVDVDSYNLEIEDDGRIDVPHRADHAEHGSRQRFLPALI
jgi:hypothetical protein